ncbi:MAG: hypothetical protein QXL14_02365 [Candidatus Aenigmatarchaeota archaeon]
MIAIKPEDLEKKEEIREAKPTSSNLLSILEHPTIQQLLNQIINRILDRFLPATNQPIQSIQPSQLNGEKLYAIIYNFIKNIPDEKSIKEVKEELEKNKEEIVKLLNSLGLMV